MKAQAFLELVGTMLAAQKDYFENRNTADLIKAKELEKQVAAVVKTGHLEPDEEKSVETQISFLEGIQ